MLATQRWLRVSCIAEGPLYRSISNAGKLGRGRVDGETIARIIQRAATRAGIEDRRFTAHSLRAGGISQMAADGAPLAELQKHSGHKSLQTLMGYIRRAQRWDGSGATAGLV